MIWDIIKLAFGIWLIFAVANFGIWLIGLNFWVSAVFFLIVVAAFIALLGELLSRVWDNR